MPPSRVRKRTTPSSPRLLLVEDDAAIHQVLSLLLERSQYVVDCVENGEQALACWAQGDYALILMDIQMPGMNGFEATAAIRQLEKSRGGHIPIIAMTAHAFREDEERCLAAGMDGYLSKPIEFQQSLQVIRETLAASRG